MSRTEAVKNKTRWMGAALLSLWYSGGCLGAALDLQDSRAGETLQAILDHDYPRLIVVMSFDQMRADYLTRFSDQFLPAAGANGNVGGFRWLMERGAVWADAHYNHIPLQTSPGHATIMTGAGPSETGIVANEWVTSQGVAMGSVEDPNLRTIGGPQRATQRGGSGPGSLLADTVGDALQLSNNSQSKLVGIAVKDRGAILMSGYNPTAVVWYDAGIGRWVTSSYYTTGTLPRFAERANEERLADRWAGKEWDYLLPKENYNRSEPEGMKGISSPQGLKPVFPKRLSGSEGAPDANYYEQLAFTPFANQMIVETAKLAVEDEELGVDETPDILCLSFSPTDYAGHAWGPNSPEAQDMMLRTDRYLADLFNYLRSAVPGGLDSVLIVLTGDHGAAPVVELAQQNRLDAGRYDIRKFAAIAQAALAQHFPGKETTNTVQVSDPYLFLRQSVLRQQGIDIVEARRVIAERLQFEPGIAAAYTRDDIEQHRLLPSRMTDAVYNGFNIQRSGDVLVLSKPFWYPTYSGTGTTHGTGFNYDTHVPLVFAGSMIKPGLYTARADVRDIAPTLSLILGINAPACSQGAVLGEMLK